MGPPKYPHSPKITSRIWILQMGKSLGQCKTGPSVEIEGLFWRSYLSGGLCHARLECDKATVQTIVCLQKGSKLSVHYEKGLVFDVVRLPFSFLFVSLCGHTVPAPTGFSEKSPMNRTPDQEGLPYFFPPSSKKGWPLGANSGTSAWRISRVAHLS